jgi:hypothetical protein
MSQILHFLIFKVLLSKNFCPTSKKILFLTLSTNTIVFQINILAQIQDLLECLPN